MQHTLLFFIALLFVIFFWVSCSSNFGCKCVNDFIIFQNDSSDSDEDSGDTGDEVDPDPSNVLPEAPLTDIDHNSQHVLVCGL